MARSHKANQHEPKSQIILNSPNPSRTKKDGGGKFSKGNTKAEIQEGIQEAKQRAFSSSPPNNAGQSMKLVIVEQGANSKPQNKKT